MDLPENPLIIGESLSEMIERNEEWLMGRILAYAKRQGFTQYTSTLKAAWRLSISGLSNSIIGAIKTGAVDFELTPETDYAGDPAASFGILEARRHRERGIDLGMFLGLMKYYRQSYLDLVSEKGSDQSLIDDCRLTIARLFDRIEIGFCMEWSSLSDKERFQELQSANRRMTNEKNKYLTIFESMQTPVAVLDIDGDVDNVNHSWAAVFEDWHVPGGKYYGSGSSAGQITWLADELAGLLEHREMERCFEKDIETKKGKRHFQVNVNKMMDISEKFRGIVVILNDITELKRAEGALRESALLLESTFDALDEAVFIATSNHIVVDVNAAAERIFGYEKDVLLNQSIAVLFKDHETYRAFEEQIRQAFKEGATASFGIMAKRKNGEIFPTEHSVSLLKKADGEPLGIVSVLRDVTERQQAEAAFRERERLQGVVEMAGAVCHELNQPLMAISGYAELILLTHSADDLLRDRISKISDQVARLGKINQKLMGITRYETKSYHKGTIIDIDKAAQ